MNAKYEWNVLLAGPALATDTALRKRLSGDYLLSAAETLQRASAVADTGEIDVVVSEQQYVDGRGVDFLQRMRVLLPRLCSGSRHTHSRATYENWKTRFSAW